MSLTNVPTMACLLYNRLRQMHISVIQLHYLPWYWGSVSVTRIRFVALQARNA